MLERQTMQQIEPDISEALHGVAIFALLPTHCEKVPARVKVKLLRTDYALSHVAFSTSCSIALIANFLVFEVRDCSSL